MIEWPGRIDTRAKRKKKAAAQPRNTAIAEGTQATQMRRGGQREANDHAQGGAGQK